MWEEGVRIYGTPGVPNNFPDFIGKAIHNKDPMNLHAQEILQW